MSLTNGIDAIDSVKKQRLFFALWPDDAQRGRLWKSLRCVQPDGTMARAVPVANFHITLVFLGSVNEVLRGCIQQAADRVVAPCFSITLDRIGYWPRSRMLWVMPAETPPALPMLVAALQDSLQDCCDIEPEHRPFKAHLTLARKLRRAPRATTIDPVPWQVTRFSLLASESLPSGSEYRELGSWPLRAVSSG